MRKELAIVVLVVVWCLMIGWILPLVFLAPRASIQALAVVILMVVSYITGRVVGRAIFQKETDKC